jgi:hypothetical protein
LPSPQPLKGQTRGGGVIAAAAAAVGCKVEEFGSRRESDEVTKEFVTF